MRSRDTCFHASLHLVGRIETIERVKTDVFFIHYGCCLRKFVLGAQDKSCCDLSRGLGRVARGGWRGFGGDLGNTLYSGGAQGNPLFLCQDFP